MKIPTPPAQPTGPLQATHRRGEVIYNPDIGLQWWDGSNWVPVPSSAFALLMRDTATDEGSDP